MSPRIIKLGVAKNNNEKISEVESITLLKGKGITNDRHFHDYNDPYNQLSLIESENIDKYNKKKNLNISYIDFRRNIVTKDIQLNNLIGKKILIGDAEILGIDLCRPCKHLEEKLGQNDIIKEFLRGGGLRCEILRSGKINVGDLIKVI